MMIHVNSVHKEQVRKVPLALKGRDSFELNIIGMDGVPQELINDKLKSLGIAVYEPANQTQANTTQQYPYPYMQQQQQQQQQQQPQRPQQPQQQQHAHMQQQHYQMPGANRMANHMPVTYPGMGLGPVYNGSVGGPYAPPHSTQMPRSWHQMPQMPNYNYSAPSALGGVPPRMPPPMRGTTGIIQPPNTYSAQTPRLGVPPLIAPPLEAPQGLPPPLFSNQSAPPKSTMPDRGDESNKQDEPDDSDKMPLPSSAPPPLAPPPLAPPPLASLPLASPPLLSQEKAEQLPPGPAAKVVKEVASTAEATTLDNSKGTGHDSPVVRKSNLQEKSDSVDAGVKRAGSAIISSQGADGSSSGSGNNSGGANDERNSGKKTNLIFSGAGHMSMEEKRAKLARYRSPGKQKLRNVTNS